VPAPAARTAAGDLPGWPLGRQDGGRQLAGRMPHRVAGHGWAALPVGGWMPQGPGRAGGPFGVLGGTMPSPPRFPAGDDHRRWRPAAGSRNRREGQDGRTDKWAPVWRPRGSWAGSCSTTLARSPGAGAGRWGGTGNRTGNRDALSFNRRRRSARRHEWSGQAEVVARPKYLPGTDSNAGSELSSVADLNPRSSGDAGAGHQPASVGSTEATSDRSTSAWRTGVLPELAPR